MSNGSSSSYVGACRKDIPYPSVSSESVPSLIDNLVYALYGTITKSVINRRVVWNIPCDPNNTALINNIPRLAGEGLLCYIIRVLDINSTEFATNLLGGALNSIPYQSAPNTTQFLPAGANGQVLGLLGNVLTWVNAPAALTTGGIAGGLAGNVLYQTAPNISGFVTNGTSGQVLISNGAASPSWSTNIAGNAATSSACTGNSVTATTATTALACSGNSATATLAATASAVSAGGVLTAMIGDNQVTPAKLETISGLAAGTYGTASTIPAITIDTKGRVTAVTTNPVSVTAPRIRAVKFAEVNGGNASSVPAFTWTSLLDSQGNMRFAGTGLTGRFGTGFDLANSVGGGFLTSQIPFTDAGEAVFRYYTFQNGTIVLSTTGNVYSTGANASGILGVGDTTDRSIFTKVAISNVASLSVADGDTTNVVHCLAVTTAGALYAWGHNGQGQLGDGTTTNRNSPVLISGGAVSGKTITKCFAFGNVGFSFVIDSDRNLYATGYNASGQLGLGDTTNRSSFVQVSLVKADNVAGSGGANTTFVRGTSWIIWDGEVYGSGSNVGGEIGDGTTADKSSFTKTIGSLTGVQSLTVSNNYSNDGASVAALKTDGTVRVWGRNTAAGQLGIGTTTNQLTPTTLAGGFAATQFSEIMMAGYVANCRFYALRPNGLLYSCGAASAASGDGVSSIRLVLTPVRQFNGLTFTDFRIYGDTGTQHSVLAITPNGELWTWGYNNALQLGVGTSTGTISTPQRVALG